MCDGITRYRGKSTEGLVESIRRSGHRYGWRVSELGSVKRGNNGWEATVKVSRIGMKSNSIQFYARLCPKGTIFIDDMPFENLTVVVEWIKIMLDRDFRQKSATWRNRRLALSKRRKE
jgi:hypothetical protein